MKEGITAHCDQTYVLNNPSKTPQTSGVCKLCPCTYQTVTVADGYSGSWGIGDVANIQALVVERLCASGAVSIIMPLHLGSGGHQSSVVVQPQVEFPAKDGDVVV